MLVVAVLYMVSNLSRRHRGGLLNPAHPDGVADVVGESPLVAHHAGRIAGPIEERSQADAGRRGRAAPSAALPRQVAAAQPDLRGRPPHRAVLGRHGALLDAFTADPVRQDPPCILQSPGAAHWFGTDDLRPRRVRPHDGRRPHVLIIAPLATIPP